MPDQATKLRELIASGSAELVAGAPGAPGVPMIVVASGRAGVGATTVAVNLAAVLADQGERVVVVDAAQRAPLVAEAAGASLAVARSLCDVLSGASPAAEALAPGPVGTLLLAHRAGARPHVDVSRKSQQRLFGELNKLRNEASVLVVDVGSGLTPWTQRFWARARHVVLVTTTGDLALMDTYALLKRASAQRLWADVRVLANQCENDVVARDVHGRLSGACQRFLSQDVHALPWLPRHLADVRDRAVFPRVWESPTSPFGQAALWLGRAVSELLAVEQSKNAGAGDGPARSAIRAGWHAGLKK